jgi:hypothetical protein
MAIRAANNNGSSPSQPLRKLARHRTCKVAVDHDWARLKILGIGLVCVDTKRYGTKSKSTHFNVTTMLHHQMETREVPPPKKSILQ